MMLNIDIGCLEETNVNLSYINIDFLQTRC